MEIFVRIYVHILSVSERIPVRICTQPVRIPVRTCWCPVCVCIFNLMHIWPNIGPAGQQNYPPHTHTQPPTHGDAPTFTIPPFSGPAVIGPGHSVWACRHWPWTLRPRPQFGQPIMIETWSLRAAFAPSQANGTYADWYRMMILYHHLDWMSSKDRIVIKYSYNRY